MPLVVYLVTVRIMYNFLFFDTEFPQEYTDSIFITNIHLNNKLPVTLFPNLKQQNITLVKD